MKKAETTIRVSERQINGEVNSGGIGNAPTSKAQTQTTDAKQITLKMLRDLKAKLYAQADNAIAASDPRNPQKIMRIQRRVDRHAAHIAFAINAVSVKM